MNRTQLDRIPLHSWATSSTIPGIWNTNPSRKTGIPVMLKKKAETSAEATFDAVSSQTVTESGRGIINSRKAAGNAKVRIHSRPRTKNPPAYKKQRNEKVTRPRESFLERPPEKNPRARIAAA